MGETLRGVRLMLAISWRADPLRSVGAAVTASGQFAVLPVRALGLAMIIDGIVSGGDTRPVAGAVVIVAASALNRVAAWASLNIRMRLREHTQLHLDSHLMGLTAGIPGIEHHEHPEYLNAVERLRTERPYLANPFNPISWSVASIVQAVVVVVLFASVAPPLAALPLIGLPAAIAAARAESRSIGLADGQAEQSRTIRHLFDLATEPGPGKEIRIYRLGGELLARRAEAFDAMEQERSRQSLGNVVRVGSAWALYSAGYAGALVWTVGAAAGGEISVGEIVLVLTLGAQLNGQLAELAFNVAWFARSLRAVRRLVWFSDYATAAHRPFELAGPRSPEPPAALSTGVAFDRVGFAYPGTHRPVLHDVSLRLPAGSTVALVGENGSGKTTMIKLLTRMYEPTAGSILADGVDIRTFGIDAWRRRLSAGFQDFARFELLARESVGAGDVSRQAADDELLGALDRAVASDVVAALPDGLATQLGRQFDGVELSVGQWQKVALGRAMLRQQPLLLLLDEPTASLDAPTEHALFERFTHAARDVARTTGGITLLVSHRFSTVRMADVIVVLTGGTITEMGTHDQLIGAGGTYAALYTLQARAYRVQR
jgi:ATP-binding cassette subfamily B protein